MNSFRLVLTVAALMASHVASAQTPAQQTGEADKREPASPSAETAQALEGSAAVSAQPRYIRGNDQVIAPPKPVPRIEGAPLSFNFEEAPVAEVVRTILGDVLKAPYVLHPPLSGTVTLSTRTPISPDQAVFLLESALQANGLALMRDARGTYHVGRTEALRGLGAAIRQTTGGGAPLPPGYGAIVVPLQYIGAGEMATILRPMAQGDAIVRVDNVRNLLVLAGTRSQAEGWLDVINTFDVDLLKGMSVGLFPLKHASIQEVEAALRLVSGAPQATAAPSGSGSTVATTGAAGAPRAASAAAMLGEGNPLFGALRIMPVDRLNSILVVTPRAAYLEEARRWIEKLDQPSDNGAEAQLFIYRVQNGSAKHLADVLSGIFGGTQGATTTANNGVAPGLGGNSIGQQPFGNTGFGNSGSGSMGANRTGSAFGNSNTNTFGGNNSAFGGQNRQNQQGASSAGATVANVGGIRVMADELNNSILVWSSRVEFQKIESTLKRLDLPPTQVLIEAAIIEVTLNDDLNYGLQWAFNGGTGGGYQGAGQLGAGGVKPGTGSLGDAAAKGFTYSLVNSAGQVRLALAALANKTLVKMISNPSLMVLDNHLAMMSVGNQVPVQTSTIDIVTSGSAVTSTVQYRDTGVNLAVTPSVNAGNLVTMQIDQTVTDTSTASGGTSAQPIFLQRQISSKVAVRSGESIVLGGLIKDSQSAGKSGVPLLQDLPLLGNLFGTNTREGSRTELLVVITPKVVRTDPEIREVSEELRDRLRGLDILKLREQPRAVQPPIPQ